jgi:two-component system C4-dicarboxylate transport sensor histidine kinase DctB
MFITFVVLLGLLFTLTMVKQFGLRLAYQDLKRQSTLNLNNLISYIDNTLGRFEKIPEVLSKHPLLHAVLTNPLDTEKSQQLNVLLEEMSDVTQASDVYLINRMGITISASNWRKESSFVGNDFSVRPYFYQAMKGELSRYYAVGLISNQRGYYFAYPVKNKAEVLGVIVIKLRVDDIENQHARDVGSDNYNFLIVGPDNVVFMSDNEEWRLNQITTTVDNKPFFNATEPPESIDVKRYAEREVRTLQILPIKNNYLPIMPNVQIFQLVDTKEKVFAQQAKMRLNDWHVHIWSGLKPRKDQTAFLMIIGTGGYFLMVILVLFTKERLRNTRQQRQANILLEKRVKERTEDLTTTNEKLLEEISQRQKTQLELKATQEELIQAAKLAVVGNMSASINHEINQPLTAIKSYSQNALIYQERNMPEKVTGNLKHIIGLTDRLANIVSQFKSFTKKSSGGQAPVLVQTSINETLAIIKHQAQKASVEIITDVPEEALYILGDGIRLEQVFVNIVSNAMQAMKNMKAKTIYINVSKVKMNVSKEDDTQVNLIQGTGTQTFEQVDITFRDTGPGILADNIDKIFEPFFTTKESFGLGIGLSISQRIIESMQGVLVVNNHDLGGAIFTISLPLYSYPPQST